MTVLSDHFCLFFSTVFVFQFMKRHADAEINIKEPIQNRRHFADDIFEWIFLNKNVWILIKISLNFVPKRPFNNIPALVQIMDWRRGDKPLSETMVVKLRTYICIMRPQWLIYEHLPAPFPHLTHCDLVTPRGPVDLGQHWLRLWLVAWTNATVSRNRLMATCVSDVFPKFNRFHSEKCASK